MTTCYGRNKYSIRRWWVEVWSLNNPKKQFKSQLSPLRKIKNLNKLMNQKQTNKQKHKQKGKQNPGVRRLTLPTLNSMGAFGVVNLGGNRRLWFGLMHKKLSPVMEKNHVLLTRYLNLNSITAIYYSILWQKTEDLFK